MSSKASSSLCADIGVKEGVRVREEVQTHSDKTIKQADETPIYQVLLLWQLGEDRLALSTFMIMGSTIKSPLTAL